MVTSESSYLRRTTSILCAAVTGSPRLLLDRLGCRVVGLGDGGSHQGLGKVVFHEVSSSLTGR